MKTTEKIILFWLLCLFVIQILTVRNHHIAAKNWQEAHKTNMQTVGQCLDTLDEEPPVQIYYADGSMEIWFGKDGMLMMPDEHLSIPIMFPSRTIYKKTRPGQSQAGLIRRPYPKPPG